MKHVIGTATLLVGSLLLAGAVAEVVVRLAGKDRILMFPR